jgi:hypothetical protein
LAIRTGDTGERLAIDQFKYAIFPTDRIAEEKAFEPAPATC